MALSRESVHSGPTATVSGPLYMKVKKPGWAQTSRTLRIPRLSHNIRDIFRNDLQRRFVISGLVAIPGYGRNDRYFR
jgi:hypothetical protein